MALIMQGSVCLVSFVSAYKSLFAYLTLSLIWHLILALKCVYRAVSLLDVDEEYIVLTHFFNNGSVLIAKINLSVCFFGGVFSFDQNEIRMGLRAIYGSSGWTINSKFRFMSKMIIERIKKR